jgi:sulfate transport system substrate-binding protein
VKDVEVITPTRSPRARRSGTSSGPSRTGGLDYVDELIKEHVRVQPKSGREALQTFTAARATCLLSYEYEATTARRRARTSSTSSPTTR